MNILGKRICVCLFRETVMKTRGCAQFKASPQGTHSSLFTNVYWLLR